MVLKSQLLRLFISACALVVLFTAGPEARAEPVPAPTTFTHPGVLSSQAELNVIRQRIAAADPKDATYAGYLSTMKTRFADLQYVPHPEARIRRGDRKPTDGPSSMRDAAMTAYTLTLKWAATGDRAAREKAQSIMAAWADAYEGSDGDINRFLDASWVLAPWCAAGELQENATYDGQPSGWKHEAIVRFKSMVRKLGDVSKQIFAPKYAPGNWQTSASLAAMAGGVFLDDPALYRQGRDYQLTNIPKVLLKGGYCNEVFRDPWHGMVSLTGVLQAAEVGRHQGDLSLFHAKYDGQDDPRILVCLRWYANPLRGIPVDLPPMGGVRWKPKPWQFTAGGNAARSTGGWEIGLNFYKYIEPSPDLQDYEDAVLKSYRPSGQDNALFIESDTMTQGDLYKPGMKYTMHQ